MPMNERHPALEPESNLGTPRLPGRLRVAFWLATAIMTGAVIMGLELVAFRLYAPYFGYSIYVWGSMISVVMLALACGYALGGWLADRSRTDFPLYLTILASGLYQLVLIFTVRKILLALWQSGEFTGTVVATLVIFVPPMTALAVTSPFIIRILARAGHVGSVAGMVYALATAGSIAGTLLTSFYLVPRFGTQITLQVLAAASILMGGLGLAARRRLALAALLPVVALPLAPKSKLAPGEVWRTESAYNLVRVIHHENLLWLVLNDARYFQTIRGVTETWSGYYVDDFALGPLLVPARRLLVLGMGGGGSILSTRAVAPDIEVDAVEIDRQVVEAGLRFFGLPGSDPRVRIHVADARPWLERHPGRYDIVHVDLYHGGPYVPFYLVTVEFFASVRRHLSEDGLVMMNVYDKSRSHEVLSATAATLRRVFPSLLVLARPDGNNVVLAFPRARTLAEVRSRLENVAGPEAVRQLARQAAHSLTEFVPPPDAVVFTDDRAPVEEMTRRVILEEAKVAQR